jgi:glutathione S-transferase
MITLYTFGPYFGLPDGSPFVVKAMVLLKMAGVAYQEDRGGYGKAPKGKLPYIVDNGLVVADSTFIRFHLEERYGADLDAGLDAVARGVAWAVEKLCEDHLYWAVIDARWGDRANFAKGPRQFFAAAPAPARALVAELMRRRTLNAARGHGLGRHSRPEIERLALRDLEALGAILGDKPFILGETPCAADASVFAFTSALSPTLFDTPLRTALEARPNLVAYVARMTQRFFPAGGGAA